MNRREASRNETNRLILNAARELFSMKGMEDCTIRDIAIKAGVSPASVLVHFKSKTLLLEAALNNDIEKELVRLITSMPDTGNPVGLHGQLMHMFTGFLKLYDSNRDLYRALLRTTLFEPIQETPRLAGQSEEFLRQLSGMIEERKAAGIIMQEVDSMSAASSIFFLYMGALITLFRYTGSTVEQVADFLSGMLSNYIQGISRRSV